MRSDVVNAADQAAAAEVMRNQGWAEGRVAVMEGWLPGLQQACTAAANNFPGTPLTTPPTSAGGTTGSAGLARALTIDAQPFLK